jgi:multiple sugar transport system permease protein
MKARIGRNWQINLALTLIMVGILVPIYWLLKSGFSTNHGLFQNPPQLFPAPPSASGFAAIWPSISSDLLTSAEVAAGTVVLALLIAVPTAYGIFLLRGERGATGSRFIVMASLAFPSIVFVTPLYSALYTVHLLNTTFGLIIADTTYSVPLAVMLLYTYMLTLPTAMIEAATIDGTSHLKMLYRIVLPVILPSVITSAIFAFLFAWGDFLFAVTFGAGQGRNPAVVAIYSLIQGNNGVTQWPQVMAGSCILAVPALVALLLGQRYIRSGLAAGAVK